MNNWRRHQPQNRSTFPHLLEEPFAFLCWDLRLEVGVVHLLHHIGMEACMLLAEGCLLSYCIRLGVVMTIDYIWRDSKLETKGENLLTCRFVSKL